MNIASGGKFELVFPSAHETHSYAGGLKLTKSGGNRPSAGFRLPPLVLLACSALVSSCTPSPLAPHVTTDTAPSNPCSRQRTVMFSGWVYFLISSGSPHVRCTPMGVRRTCGEPDEIELTAMGVKLNGSGRVPAGPRAGCCPAGAPPSGGGRLLLAGKSGGMSQVMH